MRPAEPSFIVLYWSQERGQQQVVWEGNKTKYVGILMSFISVDKRVIVSCVWFLFRSKPHEEVCRRRKCC